MASPGVGENTVQRSSGYLDARVASTCMRCSTCSSGRMPERMCPDVPQVMNMPKPRRSLRPGQPARRSRWMLLHPAPRPRSLEAESSFVYFAGQGGCDGGHHRFVHGGSGIGRAHRGDRPIRRGDPEPGCGTRFGRRRPSLPSRQEDAAPCLGQGRRRRAAAVGGCAGQSCCASRQPCAGAAAARTRRRCRAGIHGNRGGGRQVRRGGRCKPSSQSQPNKRPRLTTGWRRLHPSRKSWCLTGNLPIFGKRVHKICVGWLPSMAEGTAHRRFARSGQAQLPACARKMFTLRSLPGDCPCPLLETVVTQPDLSMTRRIGVAIPMPPVPACAGECLGIRQPHAFEVSNAPCPPRRIPNPPPI